MNDRDKIELVKKGVSHAKEFRKSSGPLFGVCGGIADYTGFPPLLIRVAVVIALVPLFWSIIPAYIILAIFMPKPNKDHLRAHTENKRQLVQKPSRDISCAGCDEMNSRERNFCHACGEPLF